MNVPVRNLSDALLHLDILKDQLAEARAERDAARATWICFHCGFQSSDQAEAAAHFGDRDEEMPLCRWWRDTPDAERVQELQSTIRELDAERAENATLRSKIESLEYQVDGIESEVSSRFKGCRTVQEAWCAFDSMEGRALLAEKNLLAAQAGQRRACEVIQNLLDSAYPHPVEHPCMFKAWREARTFLEAMDD